jgi:pimeloyl-ACP methyl ester carboxylesterase
MSRFRVTKHVFPGQHIREYPGATRQNEEDVLYLEAKQYTPLSNPDPQDGDITILSTGATSFPKEMYEPLWDELLIHAESTGLRIRAIWCVDKVDHGASGILNERTQGDDPSYFDLSRDIMHMTNIYREQMPQPIYAIGHSMGATALLELSRIHPRLLSGIIPIDPIIGSSASSIGVILAANSAKRPDLWNSRQEAAKVFRSARALKRWDPRVMDLWLEFGLRETPTLLYPEPGKVTLTTTKANESWSYARPWFHPARTEADLLSDANWIKYPDAPKDMKTVHPFYKAEAMNFWDELPHIHPPVLYVFPDTGPMSTKEVMDGKVNQTGNGVGGNGGAASGRTSKVVMKRAGHLVPFEDPGRCGRICAEWLEKEVKAWAQRRDFEKANRDDKSVDRMALSEEWMRNSEAWLQKSKSKPRL